MDDRPVPEKKDDVSRARGKGPIENTGLFVEGVVLRSIPGIYSYSVETVNKETVACKNASSHVANIIGVKDLSTLSVGTPVIVWMPTKGSKDGVILCAVPGHKAGTGKITPRQFTSDPESGFALFSEEYYKTLVNDKKFNQKLFTQAGRPYDVNPGDWAKINEHGVFLGILGLTAAMRGSQNCAIEVHTLDDLVKLKSGQYQHFSAFGEQHIYNDGGEVSVEICGSSRQHEVAGQDSIGEEVLTEEKTANPNYKDLFVKPTDVETTLKRRFQMFFGHLGLFQMFVANPESGPETLSRESKHQGLFHLNIAESGRMDVTSAAGMSMTRDDIIPVPKKLLEPWSPDGDKPETSPVAEDKEGYEPPEGFSGGAHLLVRDTLAWNRRNSYQRFDELEKDWFVPEADEMFTPNDEYDKTASGATSTEQFGRNTERRCGIYTNPDGSVTIMDAAGSQIVLDGKGGISIGGAGSINILPGTNVNILGGDDVIIKAKNSVDITATDKDVRIKAEKNLHQYSAGGVLIESAGEKSGHGFTEGTIGEDNNTSGVTIKAKKKVFIWGEDVFISGIRSIACEVLEGASRGITFVADTIKSVANNIRLAANGTAHIDLGRGSAVISAQSQAVIGGLGGVAVVDKGEYWVPLTKQAASDPTPSKLGQGSTEKSTNYDSPRSWMGEYNTDGREPIQFTFRNEAQYATNDFELYQLSWQILIDKQPLALQEVGITSSDSWEEIEVNGTMPFPGKEKITSDVYIVLNDGEQNVDENGRMKNRDSMVNTATFSPTSLNEYKVRKR